MKASRAAWAVFTAGVLLASAACGGSDGDSASSEAAADSGGADGELTTLTMAETPVANTSALRG